MNSFWETMSRSATYRESLLVKSPEAGRSSAMVKADGLPAIRTAVEEVDDLPAQTRDEISTVSSAKSSIFDDDIVNHELSARLHYLETLEKIDALERRRSLRASQLSSSPMDNLKDVIGEMAQSTRLIAKTQLKAAEKETNENTKLKSLNTADLIDFLSCFNKKSCLPAYRQVPVSLHKALIISLGLPAGSTFEANFGDELGEDVPFIKAIKKLASGRPDTKPKQVLKRHCMVDKSDLDRTALMNMLAICQEVVDTHTTMFED